MVRVVVVGGGVSGVGCALAFLRRHPECQVTIIAEHFTPNTTGDVAAGLWEPFMLPGTPEDKIIKWSQETFDLMSDWWRKGQAKQYGLSLVSGDILTSLPHQPPDFWRHIPSNYTSLSPLQCASIVPHCRSGCRFITFTAEPAVFLPTLLEEVKVLGVRLEVKRLTNLEEAAAEADLLINCSGLGARDLVPDLSVYPCRGQVMRVRAPWVTSFLCDNSESFAYIIPNLDSVVLGGTHQDNNWNLEVDPADSRAIWSSCTSLMPSLKHAEVITERVGLRPCRSKGVRLEEDELKVGSRTVPVIHNYGHGGAGVTLFWGCSQEVAGLASIILQQRYGPTSRL